MSYLSTTDYIARFGVVETARVTNQATPPAPGQQPEVDDNVLQLALDDASEVVDSYIGTLYTTPVAAAPRIIQNWVAALAREALHVNTGRSNDSIQRQADLARQALKDVQAGKATLPIPAGTEPPAQAATGQSQTSGDRAPSVFSGTCALDGYVTSVMGGCGYAPAWRDGQ